MRPLTRYLFLISRKVCVLSTYFFDKLYIFVFNFLHTFLSLKSSRFVKFVLKYDRFLDSPPFKDYNFGNRFLFVRIEERRLVYL
jgi:hypothetical protein